jgi:hypothetical protein
LRLAQTFADLAWPEPTKEDRDELNRVLEDAEGKIAAFEDQARLLVQSELEVDVADPG